jgi:hypothetical protein
MLTRLLSGWTNSKPSGQTLSGDWASLAQGLAARDPVLRLRAGHPQNDLHHELRRGAEPVFTENHQNQGKLPNGQGGV